MAVQRSATALAPHINDTWLDGKAGTARLAEAHWRAVRDWAVAWLDAHPGAGPTALAKAGARFGDEWSISAVMLGRGDVLVTVAHDQIGTTFILGRHGPHGYRSRWSITRAQYALSPLADRALGRWRSEIQNAPCPDDCRMIGGASVGRLPGSADGSSRFWVDAYYAQMAGATIGGQLSLWSWRAGRARPLLVRDYTVMAEQSGPTLRGSTLHVNAKRSWATLFACGSCFGRETDLPFAIGRGGVRALAPVSRTPELDLVDRVFAKVLAHLPTGALASPSALRVIRAQLAARLAETEPKLKGFAGMVMGWSRGTYHGRRSVCLAVDGAGTTYFLFDRPLSRIAAARALDESACQERVSRM